jgi:hypothetical protein
VYLVDGERRSGGIVSWNEHHSISEKLAVEAETARRAGEISRAEKLYRQASLEEAAALEALADDRQRTRGITAVSAVALSYKGRDYTSAAALAYRCLAGKPLPQFAEAHLRDLLQVIWTADAAEKSGIKFVTGDVLVSVKGGQVIYGGAPLDLIVQKVEGIQSVLFRTVEMLLERPFRKRGGPPADILSMFRPWLFQAPAGSYQFAVRMQEPQQMKFWQSDRPKIENVTETFFSVLRATSTNPEELPTIVSDVQYRGAFLNLSRSLAPTGTTFDRLEISDATSPTEPRVTFGVATRQEVNSALRKLKAPSTGEGREVDVRGILRGLHLDQDWLEVTTAEPPRGLQEHVRIYNAGDVLDDVVGPMVNRKVVVTALYSGSRYLYRDIELEE